MNASTADGIFSRAASLLRDDRVAEALQLLRSATVPPALQASLRFNIELCERRLATPHRSARPPVQVGIVAPGDRSKGLFRDAETIAWALAGDDAIRCSTLRLTDNLYRHDHVKAAHRAYETLDLGTPNAPAGPTLTVRQWLATLDVLVVLEALNPTLLALAAETPTLRQVLFMPNLEWAVVDGEQEDTRPWERLLREAGPRVVTIARSPSIRDRLALLRIPQVLIDWSLPDPVVRPARPPLDDGREVRVLFNGGNLGFRDRRGLDIVVRAFERLPALARPVHLVVKCNRPHDELSSLRDRPGLRVEIDTRFLPSRDDVLAYYDRADLVLYPSRFEGLGLSLLEALHRGCYVLATDGEPMSDLLPAGFRRIAAQRRGLIKLAPLYEPDPQSLADAIDGLLRHPDELVVDLEGIYRQRQERFRRDLRALVRLLAR